MSDTYHEDTLIHDEEAFPVEHDGGEEFMRGLEGCDDRNISG